MIATTVIYIIYTQFYKGKTYIQGEDEEDMIEAVEGPTPEDECVLGLEVCSDDAMCPMHEIWTHLRDSFRDRMMKISLQDVVESSKLKRDYLEKVGKN